MTTVLISVLIFEAVLGFFTSVRTRSAALRLVTWCLIPIIVGVLAIGPTNFTLYGGESNLLIFEFIILVVFGLVATGVGSVLGYLLRRLRPSSIFVRPLPRTAQKENDSSQGRCCVACREPIDSKVTICPKCGWTQPA